MKQREIKFRIWHNKGKAMYFQNIEGTDKKEVQFREKDTIGIWMTSETIFNPDKDIILMQFTGLKDKNDKEIYEGDILKTIICKSFGKNDVWYFVTFLVEVEQDGNYGYSFNWKKIKEKKILIKTKEDYNKFKESFEKFGKGETIIGNIYENTELLNEEKKSNELR